MKRPLNAQEQALRIQSRRRMIGAAVIMLCVILLLPMILDHSMGPKLPGSAAPVSSAAQGEESVVAAASLARPELPQPVADAAAAAPPVPEPAAAPTAGAPSTPIADVPPAPAPVPAPASPAEKPSPTVSASGAAAAAKSGYWVQVGVFSDRAKAQALVKKLDGQGFHAVGEEAHYKDGARVRVRIGPLHSKAEALAVTRQLEQKGIKSMVISP